MDFKKEYFLIWQDIWNFHKQFADNHGTDQEWEKIVSASSDLYEKYKGDSNGEFMKKLILSVLSELERVDKQRRLRNNGKHD